jgi:diguanylate cyclase (GGDEF)-like protein
MKGRGMKLTGSVLLFVSLITSITVQPAHPQILQMRGEKYYFEQGLKYYKTEEYELALENFLLALELNPKNRLALEYVNIMGNELKKREEQQLLDQAIKDYHQRNYEAAISKLVQVLDLNPRNRQAIDYIREIRRETSRIEEEEAKVIAEVEKPEAEKPVRQEISRMAEDIEIIKREIVKKKVIEPEELPAEITGREFPPVTVQRKLPPVISEKWTSTAIGKNIILFFLFAGGLIGAFFVYKLRMSKKRKSSDKNLELLKNLTKTATTTEHKGEILETILEAFMDTVEAKSGALLTIEDKTGDLILGTGVGVKPDLPADFGFNKDSPVFAEISRITKPVTGTEILQNSTYEDLLLFKEKPVSSSSLLLVPLTYKNRNVGVVVLSSKRIGRNYLREYRGILETLARQAAIIVANITYGRQVIIDGLTGLYVHWFFYQCLEKEISRAERQDLSLALLMLDLDHFKQFNDTYGHPMGDKALVKVAEVLKKDLRDIDTVARYGGEEFAIILPGVDEKLALRTAERIRKSMGNHRFKVVDGKFRLTLSVGISLYEKGTSAEEMVERADKALYWVKHHGRNQVKSWTSLYSGVIEA